MKILSDTHYSQVMSFPEARILEQRWKNQQISKESWKNEMLTYVQKARDVQSQKSLVNATNFDFPIIPELQDWTMEHVYKPLQELGVRKFAFVISPDVFAQFSIENIMQDKGGGAIETRFFDSYEEAFQWLQG